MSTKHRKSSMGRSHDFGTEGAGKGDSDRVSDTAAYAANYDAINWRRETLCTLVNPAWVTALHEIEGPNFESWDQ